MRRLKNAGPGLYAIHAPPEVWDELGLDEPWSTERPLYVGKSTSSFVGRVVRIDFGFSGERRTTSVTGYSTLRRSLAALLHDRDGYRGTPRNRATPGHYSNYGLTREQDETLSIWMRKRLQLAFWEKPEDCTIKQLNRVERVVLDHLLPPLNLEHVVTRWRSAGRPGTRGTDRGGKDMAALRRDRRTEPERHAKVGCLSPRTAG